MHRLLPSVFVSAILVAGIFVISFQDAEAKINVVPIKRVQVKIMDFNETPIPGLECEYVYDVETRLIRTNEEGVANDKLVSNHEKNELEGFTCPDLNLLDPPIAFPEIIPLSENTLTKIEFVVGAVQVCHEGNTIIVYPHEVDGHIAHGDTLGPC